MANIPKIRFKGFTGNWEQRKLGDIVMKKISNGIVNNPGKNSLEVKDINVVNMYTNDKIHVDELEYFNATEKDLKKCDVAVGDVFITRSSLKAEGIAEPNVLLDIGKFVFDDHLMQLKLKPAYYPFFVKVMLSTTRVRNQFIAKAKTATMTTIGQEDISESNSDFPLLSEQQKIGAFFEKIDTLINENQQKLDDLQKFKKAMLQKMFPKDGSGQPEIRFKGFTGNWEQRRLGKLLQTLPFKAFIKTPEQDGKYEIIQQGNKPIIGYANGRPCNDYKNTVIFGDHTLSLYKPNSPFFVATDGVRIVKGKHNIDGFYLLALLEKYKPQSEGYKRYYSILSDCDCSFTADDTEQMLIGSYFRTLDNLITLYQHKLNTLQRLKKAMLQKMFA